jgi:hypothetical protein
MQLALTSHARTRMRQRAIGADVLDRLYEFGHETYDHRGHATILSFDKKSRRRLARAEPWRKDLERLARCYAVVSGDGAVITVGHRRRRIGRG